MSKIRFCLVPLFVVLSMSASSAGTICGAAVGDWCTSAKDGPCGRHVTEADCQADKGCIAMRYSGESVVACHWDERGFASNCPAVGCRAR